MEEATAAIGVAMVVMAVCCVVFKVVCSSRVRCAMDRPTWKALVLRRILIFVGLLKCLQPCVGISQAAVVTGVVVAEAAVVHGMETGHVPIPRMALTS